MPDRFGKTTFSDGFNMARGISFLREEDRIDEARGIDKESFTVADALHKGKGQADLSQFSPESRYRGSKMFMEQGSADLLKKIREKQLSEEGLNLKIAEHKEKYASAGAQFKSYQALRKSGNDAGARQLGQQIFNESISNGMYSEPQEGGKLKITGWDHNTQTIDDLPIEKYDEILGQYFSLPAEQVLEMGISGDTMRQKTNLNVVSQAEPHWNPETGQVAYLVPQGTWQPDGKPRGPFFIDNPVSQQEIPSEKAAGFVPLNPSSAKAFGKGDGFTLPPGSIRFDDSGKEIARGQKKDPASGKIPYERDKAKLIDDTRAYYNERAKAFMNELGGISDQNSYDKIVDEMQADLARVMNDEKPRWTQKKGGNADIPELPKGFVID